MPDDPRALRTTFDSAAALYARARPDYPAELYEDLVALTGLTAPADLLEVGCGPGNATLPLARAGHRITAVELGGELAAEARRNLSPYPAVSVVNAGFEEWQPPDGTRYDLVYAATAWHWIDPAIGWAKAASLLRPGGHLALWGAGHAFPPDADPIFTELQRVYEEIGEPHIEPWPPAPPRLDSDIDDLPAAAAEHFEARAVRRHLWALRYDAEAYLRLLDTFSGHIAFTPDQRNRLYGEVRRLLAARPDGQLTRHWSATLTVMAPRGISPRRA